MMHIMEKNEPNKNEAHTSKRKENVCAGVEDACIPPETYCWQLLLQCELIHDRKSKGTQLRKCTKKKSADVVKREERDEEED